MFLNTCPCMYSTTYISGCIILSSDNKCNLFFRTLQQFMTEKYRAPSGE